MSASGQWPNVFWLKWHSLAHKSFWKVMFMGSEHRLCVSHTNKQKTQYLSVSLYEMIVTISLKKAIISNLKLISTNQSHGLFYFIFLQ